MRFTKLSRLPLLFTIIGSSAVQIFGIEAVTNPVGIIQVNALGDSDTLVSIPLKQPGVFNGVVNSTAGNVLTAEGNPGWSADEWVDTHYAFLRSGAAVGFYAAITGNSADSLTLDVEDLADLAGGDSFSIHSFWTLDLLFPQGMGVNASASHADRASEIFIPGFGMGINLAAEATYYYYDGAWRKIGGDLTGDYGGTSLAPDSYFVLRNNGGSTTVTFTGEVVMGDLGLPVMFTDVSQQDNIIGLQRPIEMTIDESGLVSSGAFEVGDELLVWNHDVAEQNRLASNATIYTYDGAKWVKDGGTEDAGGDMVFTPGRGFIIRKATGTEVSDVDWLNSPNYPNNDN